MKRTLLLIAAWLAVSTVSLLAMKAMGVPGYAEVGHSWYYGIGGFIGGLMALPIYKWIWENVQ